MSKSLRIKETIKKYGLTINEVSKRMNITRQTFGTHINGNPSVEILERIADAIGCSITELFEENNNLICPHCGKHIKIKLYRQ